MDRIADALSSFHGFWLRPTTTQGELRYRKHIGIDGSTVRKRWSSNARLNHGFVEWDTYAWGAVGDKVEEFTDIDLAVVAEREKDGSGLAMSKALAWIAGLAPNLKALIDTIMVWQGVVRDRVIAARLHQEHRATTVLDSKWLYSKPTGPTRS